MSMDLMRLSITLLGVAALTTGSYCLSLAHGGASSYGGHTQPFSQTLLQIEMEEDIWSPQDLHCNCSQDDTSSRKNESSSDKQKDCSKPSPAERMGMAIRLVSL